MQRNYVTNKELESFSVTTYTEKEKNKIEFDFIDGLIDSLQVIKEAKENSLGGCWILDGGLGDFLEKQGEIYVALMQGITVK